MNTNFLAGGILMAALASGFGQPAITGQPQSQTNVVGSTVTLTVEATGTPPLFYQWRRQSTALAGQTNDTLVIASLQSSNAGNYTVIVANIEGSVTSSVAFVRILLPPTITTQPANRMAEPGSTVTLQVVAAGTAPLAYQWRSNDVPLLARANSNLVFTNVQFTSAADYSVVVTNVVGSVTSQVATLTVSLLAGFENEVLNYMTANNVSAATLAVMKDGRLVFKRGYGWRDRAKTQPMDPDGRMRLLSNSKEFCAAAFKRLVAVGALALTNRAYALVGIQPYNGAWGDPRFADVMLEHLVGHRCGWDQFAVPFATQITVGNALGLDRTGSIRDLIAYEVSKPLQFTPGTRFAYSSVGYAVLAQGVQRAANLPYFEYVRREVLRPWGLHRTKPARTFERLRELDEPWYDPGSSAPSVNRADFPTTELVPLPDGGQTVFESAIGAGEMISSAEEMVRLAQVHWISHGVAFIPNATVPAEMNGDLRVRRAGGIGAQSGVGAGSRTFVLQNTNGVDLAVLTNHGENEDLGNLLVTRLKAVSERISSWPGDNSTQIELGAATFKVEENEGRLTIGVRRSGDSSGAVAVNYATVADTAQAGVDFVLASGTVGFGPDEITALISIPILDDSTAETDETFRVVLSDPTGGASLGVGIAAVTIEDDDRPLRPPLIELAAPGAGFVSPAGSNVTIAVTTSASDGGITAVEYYAGPTFLGEENKPPYTFIWKNPGLGAYLLTARATDNRGLMSTSAPIRITVGPAPVEAGAGTIRREFWRRRPGTAMTFLTNYQHYPARPTGWQILTNLEVQTDWGDFYGARIRGFVEPPTTGDYVLWVAARDRAELWLSADGDPWNKMMVASVQIPTAPRAWEQSATQRSAPIRLTAGQRCYVELLYKAETAQDHAAVGWQLPGGELERPIPGPRLLPFDLPALPQIQAPTVSPNGFRFNLHLPPGSTVVIDSSTDLLNWFPLRTNTAAGFALEILDPDAAIWPHRFYRARLLP